ncbi:hypothetical protein WG66_011826 [Moniliophthora roreri]|uniref:Uncharacterized protein n=1 Tax=Moniliophthora roreri TaxID=221103 RepID=A0A0W0F2G3_MONRR|nr:hypothetical protein WG66_011826 [Moniliophthora roreri]
MQTPQHRGGYSSFFASGFRAITSRNSLTINAPSFSSEKDVWVADEKRSPFRTSSGSAEKASEKRQRRTSFVHDLFDKMAVKTSDAYKKRKNRRSSLFVDSKSTDLWTWPESHPYSSRKSSVGTSAENPPQQVSIDPFSSSPDSKSFFIDLTDGPVSSTKTPLSAVRRFSLQPTRTRRHSFLSFSSSSRENSVMNLPTRRERPVSICTMPAMMSPSLDPYTRSSGTRSVHSYPGKDLSEWLEDESEEASSTPVEWNDPGSVDWHQFHGQLLDDGDLDDES